MTTRNPQVPKQPHPCQPSAVLDPCTIVRPLPTDTIHTITRCPVVLRYPHLRIMETGRRTKQNQQPSSTRSYHSRGTGHRGVPLIQQRRRCQQVSLVVIFCVNLMRCIKWGGGDVVTRKYLIILCFGPTIIMIYERKEGKMF